MVYFGINTSDRSQFILKSCLLSYDCLFGATYVCSLPVYGTQFSVSETFAFNGTGEGDIDGVTGLTETIEW